MGLDSGNPRGEPGSTEPTTCPAPGAQAPGCLGSFPEICQSCRRQRDRSPLFLAERDFKGLKALSDLNPAMFHSFDPRKSTMPRRTVKSFFTLLCSPISQHFPPPLPGAFPLMLFFAWLHSPSTLASLPPGSPSGFFRGLDGWELTLLSTYKVAGSVSGVHTHPLITVSHPPLSSNDCLFFFFNR